MDALQAYFAAAAPGMDIVAGARGRGERELRSLGATGREARELTALTTVYFGPTHFTGRQARARGTSHSLATLKLIEGYVRRVKGERAGWKLREELCAAQAGDVEGIARARLRELARPREVKEGKRLLRRKGGLWTLSITGPSSVVADLDAVADANQPAQSLAAAVFTGGATAPEVRTNVIVELDALDRIVNGDGEEITLEMTNGARMSGADLVTRVLAEHGYVTLVHPHEGPVNLYRTSRFANDKQRLMAGAENPTCAWPGCNFPADAAQIHHLEAWRRGGMTNMANLATCCPYHNGVNSDEPHGPPGRGRLARIDGRVSWVPPWAEKIPG